MKYWAYDEDTDIETEYEVVVTDWERESGEYDLRVYAANGSLVSLPDKDIDAIHKRLVECGI